jgi:hypothetical protein
MLLPIIHSRGVTILQRFVNRVLLDEFAERTFVAALERRRHA